MRALIVSLCFAIGLLGSPLGSAQFADVKGLGQIESIDIPANTLMISGFTYRVAIDARVEINGTFGAFTLLQPGMKVRFSFRNLSRTEREISSVEQLPNSTVIEGT